MPGFQANLLCILVFSVTAISSSPLDCGAEISNYLSCVNSFTLSDPSRFPWGINFGKLRNMVSDCFVSNGCRDIELPTPHHAYQHASATFAHGCLIDTLRRRKRASPLHNQDSDEMLFHLFHGSSIEKEFNFTFWPEESFLINDGLHFASCKRSVRRELEREIEECAKKLLGRGFVVPEEIDEKVADAAVDHILLDDFYPEVVYNLTQDNVTCPRNHKAQGLRQCLGIVFSAIRDQPDANPFEKRARWAKIKACNSECVSRVGKCHDELKKAAVDLCQCVPQDRTSFYSGMLKDCYPDLTQRQDILDSVIFKDFNIVRSRICFFNAKSPCS